MEKPLIIIKLGGSVITKKDSSTPKIRIEIIKQLAKEIKKISDSKKYQIILVHGAGSFGHPLAKKYNLHLGMKTDEQKYGFCKTDQKMQELNFLITKEFLKQKIPVISLSPRSFIKQSAGKLLDFNYQLITDFLKQNFIPILFGDAVLDDKWNCSIISGDIIIGYLANKLKANQVIFLSDVDGIFNEDPKVNPQAVLIPKVNDQNLSKVLAGTSVNNKNDVTGQMAGKILGIKQHLSGVTVYVVNGFKPNSLTQATLKNQIGTKLHFD